MQDQGSERSVNELATGVDSKELFEQGARERVSSSFPKRQSLKIEPKISLKD